MKTNEFVKIIKEVIRQEVKKAVRDELNTFLTEMYTPTTKKSIPTVQKPIKKAIPQPKPNNFKMTHPTNIYGPLGDILQETANGMSHADFNDWGDMGIYTSDHAIGSGISMGEALNSEDLPDISTNSLIKDYSAVLKAADKYSKGQ